MRARTRKRSCKPALDLFTEMAKELGWKPVGTDSAKAVEGGRRKRRRK